jgi:RNA polymerase sigma factor (sigma-70 family)
LFFKKEKGDMFSADKLDPFYRRVLDHPILTREKEQELIAKYQESNDPDVRCEARDELVCCNQKLVFKNAVKYARRLPSSKRKGLVVFWFIRQKMKRAIENQGRTIRVPVHMLAIINKLVRTSRHLTSELEREPTLEEVADKMGVSFEKVMKILKTMKEPVSLDIKVSIAEEEEEVCLTDFIEDENARSPLDAAINLDISEQAVKVLATLRSREEKVLRMRFGIREKRSHTLQEIGDFLGITRERVRQIETKAIKKLKARFYSKGIQKLKVFWEEAA